MSADKKVCPCWQARWQPQPSDDRGPFYRLLCDYCDRSFGEAFFALDAGRTVAVGRHWEQEGEPK